MTDRTREYYRLMLGRKSIHAELCFSENFVGLDWFPDTDFAGEFTDNWKILIKSMFQFNKNRIRKIKSSSRSCLWCDTHSANMVDKRYSDVSRWNW